MRIPFHSPSPRAPRTIPAHTYCYPTENGTARDGSFLRSPETTPPRRFGPPLAFQHRRPGPKRGRRTVRPARILPGQQTPPKRLPVSLRLDAHRKRRRLQHAAPVPLAMPAQHANAWRDRHTRRATVQANISRQVNRRLHSPMDTAFQVAVQGRALDALSRRSFLPVGTGNFRRRSSVLNDLSRAGHGAATPVFAKLAACSANGSSAAMPTTGCRAPGRRRPPGTSSRLQRRRPHRFTGRHRRSNAVSAGGYRMFPAPALRRPMPLPARLPPQLNVVLHFAGQVRATADLKSCLQSGTGVELQAETQRL